MRKSEQVLYGLIQASLIVSGTFYLFQALPFFLIVPDNEQIFQQVKPILYAEPIFLFLSWVLLVLTIEKRLLMLVYLIAGQLSLYFLHQDFWILGYRLPFFVLISVNGMYLLALYFILSKDKWAPAELAPEEFDLPDH